MILSAHYSNEHLGLHQTGMELNDTFLGFFKIQLSNVLQLFKPTLIGFSIKVVD